MPNKAREFMIGRSRVRVPADGKHSLKDCMVKPDAKDIPALREKSLRDNVELRKKRDQRLADAAEKRRLASARERDIAAGVEADVAEAEGRA